VWLAAGLLFLAFLGSHDLWAPDEPYFAEGAREMVVDGRWAVPHVNGVVTLDKPPLFFWCIALLSLPLGAVTSWTARLPSALAAVGTVALTMRLGGRLFGRRTAILAGLALSTTYLFWEKARWSQTDSLLCFLEWVALSAFVSFRSGDARGSRAGLLFWLAAALAVLEKGPVGFVVPCGIVLLSLAIDRDLGRLREFAPAAGPLLFLGIIGGWIALATIGGHGEYSVWNALRQHVLVRAVAGMHHKQPPWYFLEVLPANLLPWTAVVPGALVLAWRRRSTGDRFLLATVLFVLVFFSLITEKRELYVLPAFPAFALLTASLFAAVCGWNEAGVGASSATVDRRWVTVAQGILGAILLLAGLAVPLLRSRVEELNLGTILLLSVLFLLGGAATLAFALRGRMLETFYAPAACCALAYLALAALVYPSFEARNSARLFSLRIAEVTASSRSAGVPVVAFALGNLPEAFSLYTNGVYTLETDEPTDLVRHLERTERAFAVVDGGMLDTLPATTLSGLRVVDRARLNERNVLLVTNGDYPGATGVLPTDREEPRAKHKRKRSS
jgi:4-amino-4-deoxy-L-arabinose transferase-like glycosyltransferase